MNNMKKLAKTLGLDENASTDEVAEGTRQQAASAALIALETLKIQRDLFCKMSQNQMMEPTHRSACFVIGNLLSTCVEAVEFGLTATVDDNVKN